MPGGAQTRECKSVGQQLGEGLHKANCTVLDRTHPAPRVLQMDVYMRTKSQALVSQQNLEGNRPFTVSGNCVVPSPGPEAKDGYRTMHSVKRKFRAFWSQIGSASVAEPQRKTLKLETECPTKLPMRKRLEEGKVPDCGLSKGQQGDGELRDDSGRQAWRPLSPSLKSASPSECTRSKHTDSGVDGLARANVVDLLSGLAQAKEQTASVPVQKVEVLSYPGFTKPKRRKEGIVKKESASVCYKGARNAGTGRGIGKKASGSKLSASGVQAKKSGLKRGYDSNGFRSSVPARAHEEVSGVRKAEVNRQGQHKRGLIKVGDASTRHSKHASDIVDDHVHPQQKHRQKGSKKGQPDCMELDVQVGDVAVLAPDDPRTPAHPSCSRDNSNCADTCKASATAEEGSLGKDVAQGVDNGQAMCMELDVTVGEVATREASPILHGQPAQEREDEGHSAGLDQAQASGKQTQSEGTGGGSPADMYWLMVRLENMVSSFKDGPGRKKSAATKRDKPHDRCNPAATSAVAAPTPSNAVQTASTGKGVGGSELEGGRVVATLSVDQDHVRVRIDVRGEEGAVSKVGETELVGPMLAGDVTLAASESSEMGDDSRSGQPGSVGGANSVPARDQEDAGTPERRAWTVSSVWLVPEDNESADAECADGTNSPDQAARDLPACRSSAAEHSTGADHDPIADSPSEQQPCTSSPRSPDTEPSGVRGSTPEGCDGAKGSTSMASPSREPNHTESTLTATYGRSSVEMGTRTRTSDRNPASAAEEGTNATTSAPQGETTVSQTMDTGSQSTWRDDSGSLSDVPLSRRLHGRWTPRRKGLLAERARTEPRKVGLRWCSS